MPLHFKADHRYDIAVQRQGLVIFQQGAERVVQKMNTQKNPVQQDMSGRTGAPVAGWEFGNGIIFLEDICK